MPLQIFISDQILIEALDIQIEERATIERIKEKELVDEIIIAGGRRLAEQLSGLAANRSEKARLERAAQIVATLDVAIALIALAEDVEEVERLKKVAVLLGRQHKKPVKVNTQELWPALRVTFQRVSKECELDCYRENVGQRAFIRRKVRAAIKIINESLANSKTRWEW